MTIGAATTLRAGVPARATPPAPTPTPTPASTPAKGAGSDPDVNARSALAAGTLAAGVGLNIANRVLSVARLTAATPIAWREHKMPLWTLEMALQKSTVDIVPYQGGKWGLWGKAYAASAGLKFAGALLTVGMAIPNTTSALRNGGPAALVDTRPGRTGVISSVAGVATLGFLGVAASHGAHAGPLGAVKSMFTDPLLGKWAFVGPMIGAYTLVLGNELGFFDMFNRGETRSPGAVVRDATTSIPQNVGTILHGG